MKKLVYIQIVFNLSWLLAIALTLLLAQISNISIALGSTISGVLVVIYPFIMMRISSKIKLSMEKSSPFYLYPILIGFLLISANIGGYISARTYFRVLNAPVIELSDPQSQQSIENAFFHIVSLKKIIAFETSKRAKTYNKNEVHASYNYECYQIVPMIQSTANNNKINSLISNASMKLWLTSLGRSLSPGCNMKKEKSTGYVITIDNGENSKTFEKLVHDVYKGNTPRIRPLFVKNSLEPQAEIKKRFQILLLVPIIANVVSLLILLMLFFVYRKKSI